MERGVIRTLSKMPEKSRDLILSHFARLEDPFGAPDVECIHSREMIYRMHIGRTYTVFFKIYRAENEVRILDLMTIEQAHKRYGRYS